MKFSRLFRSFDFLATSMLSSGTIRRPGDSYPEDLIRTKRKLWWSTNSVVMPFTRPLQFSSSFFFKQFVHAIIGGYLKKKYFNAIGYWFTKTRSKSSLSEKHISQGPLSTSSLWVLGCADIALKTSLLLYYLCNFFEWHTVKYPTNKSIFHYTYEPLDECVYKKSSLEWDIHGMQRENIA